MKPSFTSIFLAALAAGTTVAEKKVFTEDDLRATSAPNAVSMQTLRARKEAQFSKDRANGLYDLDRYEKLGATPCKDGKAGEYSCNKVDLQAFLRHQDTGSQALAGNDIWGWTDSSSGREFALLGQADGTAFVEVLKDGSLRYAARLPTQTDDSTWRDIKVIGNHAYIGSEAADHGMQVFDLKKLLKADPKNPPTYSISSDLAAHFDGFGSSHNLVAHEEVNMIYAVGTQRSLKCRAGLWAVDVSNPRNPQDAGCAADDGYVHDAQCVIYNGPQTAYQGREICFGYNEDAFTIYDFSRKFQPRILSRTVYKGATYTHQGWVTDDHKYILLDDELDEQEKTGPAEDQHTTTYIVDIQDLAAPIFKGVYKSPQRSIDHNQYIVDGISYQANYGSGLRMVNITTINEDDTGAGFEEIGFFDVDPADDDVGGEATFNGAWSVYPYFQSGNIVVSSIERGIFSLRYTG